MGGKDFSDEREKMYQTATLLTRELRIWYPLAEGRIVLRTSLDWECDLEAVSVSDDGTCYTFALEARRPFLYFKPCLRLGDELRWSVGSNELALMTHPSTLDVYPYFSGSEHGTFSPLIELDSTILGRRHAVRAYVPPGYYENTLKRYPALFMQDGKNLFFPEEAFAGREWSVDETLQLLDRMNAIDKVVVLGIYSGDRTAEYTKPGYEAYGRSVVEEVVPAACARLRLIGGPQETAVMGSSLGGVVSFFMAWQWPDVFGAAASMSSTFSYRDDLIERVLTEPKSRAKFYLDSGWPGDNFETTLAMALALESRGYVHGSEYLHLAFPLEEHEESAWGSRLHLPLQLFWGKVSMAQRGGSGPR
jgi:predicted alpha/beta superfamily hydrolase